jgi:hypothetical protein
MSVELKLMVTGTYKVLSLLFFSMPISHNDISTIASAL